MEQVLIEGVPRVNEVVFFHVPSRTLIITDLLFNIEQPRGWQSRLVLTLVGARGRVAQSRLWRLVTRDRKAAAESIRRMLSWEPERVVMAHGAILTRDAKLRAQAGLSWMLR